MQSATQSASATRSAEPIKIRIRAEQMPFGEFLCMHRKFLLMNMLSRNLKLKYRRSVFGYLWTLLIPLAQAVIFYFLYKIILKVSIDHYVSFLTAGILPWVFFSSSINESMEALVGNHTVLVHAPMPIQVFPLSISLTNFVNFLPSIPLIYIVYALDTHALPPWTSLLILPLCFVLFVFTYALSFLLSCFFIYLRDLKHLMNIITQLWLYVTPVLYSSSMIPKGFHWVNWVNPISGFYIALDQCLFDRRLPDPLPVLAFVVWSFGTLVLADAYRKSFGKHLVEKL